MCSHSEVTPLLLCSGSMFNPEEPVEAVHLEKHRTVFLPVEDGFWLCMEVNNPTYIADGATQYSEEELDDKALQRVLQQAYDAYRLFNGTMESEYAKGGGVDVPLRLSC